MGRLLPLVGMLLLAVAIWTGGIAHAAEPVGCIEISETALGHFDGDRDEVPADADKGAPHHHGGCHGHHAAVASETGSTAEATSDAGIRASWLSSRASGAEPEATLRPPIA